MDHFFGLFFLCVLFFMCLIFFLALFSLALYL